MTELAVWPPGTSGGGATRLQDLTDVDAVTAVVDGKDLRYDAVSGKFKGATPASGGGGGGGFGPVLPAATGAGYSLPASDGGNINKSTVAHFYPFTLGRARNLDRIGAHIATAGSVDCRVAFGIWLESVAAPGLPGLLLAHYGVVDGSTAAVKLIAIAQALLAGTQYFVGSYQIKTGAPGTPPTTGCAIRGRGSRDPSMAAPADLTNASIGATLAATVTAAYTETAAPDNPNPIVTDSANVVLMRFA